MLFVGIDPGIRGGISILDTDRQILWATEMPVINHARSALERGTREYKKPKKPEYDIPRIAYLLRGSHRVCIEAVHSMPGQGVSSTFLFGKGYGILLGVIGTLGIDSTSVAPRTWKKAYYLSADKNVSRARASEIFPHCGAFWKLKKHDGLAEAALLAHYICGIQDNLDLVVPGDISNL